MKRRWSRGWLLALVLLVSTAFAAPAGAQTEKEAPPSDLVPARVLEVSEYYPIEGQGAVKGVQYVRLQIIGGEYKGQVVRVENKFSGNPAFDLPVRPGEKVLVSPVKLPDGSLEVFIQDYYRQDYIGYILALFVLLLLLVGRTKGAKAILTLTLTMLVIFKWLLPSMLRGYSPIPITVVAAATIALLTLFIVCGVNRKSLSAVLGTVGGVVLAGLIAYGVGCKVRLTGLSSEEASMLMFIPQKVNFDFRGLLFAGILLGALGAVMDVCISVAAAMEEVYNANRTLVRRELLAVGLNVGRDIMGTMINTLILAYTGSAIPLLLLFMAYQTSLTKLLNLDVVATEVVRSLAGSIGMVLAVPLTAVAASFLLLRHRAGSSAR
ncbi:YibE/F family protein [Desulfothermobacter acidiphilus]|uniref:YibE/F family protein n=1 Tax=Desulfothermobacter acidiphilus TaxID=1938353 RepID=UPI003F8AA3B0